MFRRPVLVDGDADDAAWWYRPGRAGCKAAVIAPHVRGHHWTSDRQLIRLEHVAASVGDCEEPALIIVSDRTRDGSDGNEGVPPERSPKREGRTSIGECDGRHDGTGNNGDNGDEAERWQPCARRGDERRASARYCDQRD